MSRLNYIPRYDGVIEGWVVNYLKKNFWRVRRCMEYEDIKQESFVIFLKVKKQYRNVVDNDKWFMSLYKTSFINSFIDISSINTNMSCLTLIECELNRMESEYAGDEYQATLIGDLDNDGMMELSLKHAPERIRQIIFILCGKPNRTYEMLICKWVKLNKKKVYGNQMLCEMLGEDCNKVDLVKEVKEYFLK